MMGMMTLGADSDNKDDEDDDDDDSGDDVYSKKWVRTLRGV